MLKRQNAGKAWTAAADDKLRQLCAEGVRTGDIAVVLGRTREAVARRANSLKLKVRA